MAKSNVVSLNAVRKASRAANKDLRKAVTKKPQAKRSRRKARDPFPGLKDPAAIELVKIIQASRANRAEISRKSGVSRTCISNWEKGKTMRPQGATMDFVARAMGYHRPWVPTPHRG